VRASIAILLGLCFFGFVTAGFCGSSAGGEPTRRRESTLARAIDTSGGGAAVLLLAARCACSWLAGGW